MPTLNGSLFRIQYSSIENFSGSLEELDEVTLTETLQPSRWKYLYFETSHAIINDEDHQQHGPPFRYHFYTKQHPNTILLLADSAAIVKYLANVLAPRAGIKYKQLGLDVHRLVHDISNNDSRSESNNMYALSFIHAKVNQYADQLKTISLYGDDIAQSSLFYENIEKFDFHNCGLSKPYSGREIVKLGHRGTISVHLPASLNHSNCENVFDELDTAYEKIIRGYLIT